MVGSMQTVDGSPVLSASEGFYVSVLFLIVKRVILPSLEAISICCTSQGLLQRW